MVGWVGKESLVRHRKSLTKSLEVAAHLTTEKTVEKSVNSGENTGGNTSLQFLGMGLANMLFGVAALAAASACVWSFQHFQESREHGLTEPHWVPLGVCAGVVSLLSAAMALCIWWPFRR